MKVARTLTAIAMAGALAPVIVFAAGENGKLIAPGEGIGAARLGMTEAQAIAAMGKPDQRLHVTTGYLDLFGGIRVFLGEDGRAVRIETDDDGFRTGKGLGVGSTEKEIVAALGKPALAEDMKVRNDNLLMPQGRRLCYEPGLVFTAEYPPQQPHATTLVSVRRDGCAKAFQ